MPAFVATTLRRPALRKARNLARSWVHEHVDRPVVSALTLGAALRHRAPDVVYFGDSSLLHISPFDSDRRRLGEMLGDVSGLTVGQFYGPGYPAAVSAEAARLIQPLPRPKAIVVSVAIRPSTQVHVHGHPIYGYPHARRTLAQTRRIGPALVTRVRRPTATPEEYAAFDGLERRSRWGGVRTVGDYRRELKGIDIATASDEAKALLFDYFHGEYSAGSPGLDEWQRFGGHLRTLGIPVLVYRTHMPYEAGTRILGPDFVPHVEENFRLVEGAMMSGLGEEGTLVSVEPPPDSHYIQPEDGTEHYNQDGRLALVRHLSSELRRAVS